MSMQQFAPYQPQPPKPSIWKNPAIIVLMVFGALALGCVACGGIGMVWLMKSFERPPQTDYANLMEGRETFETQLTTRDSAGYPAPTPPDGVLNIESYSSPAGPMAAYVSPDPGDGQKHPAIIWVFGGFSNSISETAWEPASSDNDQSASAFRDAGIVMMYPSFRGGNTNPGYFEGFYGEVDDLLAALEHLKEKDYVDPNRIYLGGHSTGGTLVMLASAASDEFRAVFAFGPVDDVFGYGPDVLPFNVWDSKEISLRNPIQWLHAMQSPVFVIEGSYGNSDCLRNMRRRTSNPLLHFHEVPDADHFEILAPLTALLANKIQQDIGSEMNISLSDQQLRQAMSQVPY